MAVRAGIRIIVVACLLGALVGLVPAAALAANPNRIMTVDLTIRDGCATDVVVTWEGQPGRGDRLAVQLNDFTASQAVSATFADGRAGSVTWNPALTAASESHRLRATARLIDARGRTVSQASSAEQFVACQIASS